MQITFDPHNAQECDETLGFIAQAQPSVVKMWLIDYNESQDADTPPAQTAQPDTAPAAQPDTAQPETAQPETDCHGMTHNDTIHSTPASKNADGSWRAKRGQKEAYEAAIAAATGKDAPAPAPQGMPVPQPASAVPATPPGCGIGMP